MAGPMPGSTPTAVPRSTPMTAYSRFIGVAACAKPWSSQSKFSISEDPVENACGQRDSEPGVERVEAGDGEHRPDDEVANVMAAAEDGRRTGEQQSAGDGPPRGGDEQDRGHEQT